MFVASLSIACPKFTAVFASAGGLYSGQLRQDFTTFALSAIKANYMIVNLICILLTVSARDHIPILNTLYRTAMCEGGLPLRSVGRVRKLQS